MLETLLAKVGLPMLISFLSGALEEMDNPVSKGASKALKQVDSAIRDGQISAGDIAEANRHIENLAALQSEEIKDSIAQVNESLRAEIASQDKYIRRMRPTFGYLMALTWAAQMFGIAYIIVFDPARAGEVMNGMASLSAIWAVGLSVLGIYVYKRSEDKKVLSNGEVIFWNR